MQKQNKAYFLALTAVLFWSTVASAFKISLQYLDYFQLLFFSSLVSTLILFVIIISQNKFREIGKTSTKDLLKSVLMGFLNPFLYYVVLFRAYSLLKAQEAGTLNYVWPVVIVLLSVPLLKQKISVKSLLAILISFTGAIIIGTNGRIFTLEFSNLEGVFLALGSSVIWSLFWIFNLKDHRDTVIKLLLNFVFGLIYITLACLIFSEISLPNLNSILGSTYIGIFEMGITYIIWLRALQLSSTTAKISNIIFLSPFISLIIIYFTVGEDIMPSTIFGLCLIIGGIIIQKYSR
jgi:drug/metabolite transporter (DMT)-like permease